MASWFALAFARLRCAEGAHVEEVRLARAAACDVITDEDPSHFDAWTRLVTGLGHCIDDAAVPSGRPAAELRTAALDAITDLSARFGEEELRRSPVLRANSI
jgi:pyrroloquinoline quinone (PQQ) biosynthesis protein C